VISFVIGMGAGLAGVILGVVIGLAFVGIVAGGRDG
jgi:hypothetical protein